MIRAELARQASIDRVGDAYVYGAWDELCTVANRNKRALLREEYAETIKNQCQRTKSGAKTCTGCKYEGRKIHDCRGLTATCAKVAGIQITGQTVAAQWNADNWERKGTIDTMPTSMPYVQLFRHNGTKWTHTGIYIGDAETVDARGHATGVIRAKLSSYKWTHWAIPKGMYEDILPNNNEGGERVIYSAVVTTNGGHLNIRKGPSTSEDIIGFFRNGDKVDIHEERKTDDAKNPCWAHIAGDGITGWASMNYLSPIDRPEDTLDVPEKPESQTFKDPEEEIKTVKAEARVESYGVYIPCDNEEEAARYAGNIKNAIVIRYEKPPDVKAGE